MARRNIECIACGNCCPDRCGFKVDNLCTVHPSIVGEKEAFALRGVKCYITPTEVQSWGYFCPPVAEAFWEETRIVLEPVQNKTGVVLAKDWHQRYFTEAGFDEKWLGFVHGDAEARGVPQKNDSNIFSRLMRKFVG